MVQARDIMVPGAPSLSFDSTVTAAVEFLKVHSNAFVAVKASEDRYQGVLTEGNMVRIFLRFQSQPQKEALIFYRDCFEPLQLIHEEEQFPEVVKKIMTSVGHRVFVINSAGAVIGHITAKDVLPLFTGTLRSVAEKQSVVPQIESLRSELYLYESFFEKSPFMMHSVNPQGEILMANEMLHSILGYAYGELIGKTIFELYPKENHKKAEAGLKTILNKGFHQVVQAQMIDKEGSLISVELASRALTDQHGKPIGTMTVSRPLNMDYLLKSLNQSQL